MSRNPFEEVSPLPYGLPPFDVIAEEHYRPAFEAGMARQRAEVAAIGAQGGPATVGNTLDALESSGQLLSRVSQVFFNLTSSAATDGLRAIEEVVVPQLTAHHDAILMDPVLFARIGELHGRRAELDAEAARLVERLHLDMTRAGAALPPADQERLRAINSELSTLGTTFRNRLQADTNDLAVHVTDAARLAGMSDDAVAACAGAARARGLEGYLITLVLPTRQPAEAVLEDRELRKALHRAAIVRGARDNANDTRSVIARVVTLRAEKAALLGYADHAAFAVADQTAGTVEAVTTLLTSMVGPAVANAHAEAAQLQELLAADGVEGPLQPWDWAYYAEKLAQQRFSRDSAALRPYFELDSVVRNGVFAAAGELYGLRFARRPDLPAYHPDVQVYEVFDGDRPLGLFLADWYARDSKRGGAWMNTFVDQSGLLGHAPVAVINLNVPRPADGAPTLLTLDEVRTAFHEFGHVLHGLLSDVRYPRLSGTNVPRDFVEFPSQVNEMWAWWPELVRKYARHHETGEPLPEEALAGLLAAQSFGEGFATTEILAAMLLDQAWHRRGAGEPPVGADDVEAFEQEALEAHGLLLEQVRPRYRSSYFAHIFAGGYSASYYSYLWSEVLDADTVEWFVESGGMQRSAGESFRRELLSRGGAVDPMQAYTAFRGRGPRVEPLLERRGLLPVEP